MKRQSLIFIIAVIAAVFICTCAVTLINGCTERGGLSPELPEDSDETETSGEGDGQGAAEPKYLCSDGWYYKKAGALDEKSVVRFAEKVNWLCETYLDDQNRVFWSVIPDKNYYLTDAPNTAFNYEKLDSLLKENVKNGKYIDIYSSLDLESFYRTDIHWRQEKLLNVVSTLGDAMDFVISDEFSENYYENYVGMYNEKPDGTALTDEDGETLVYLTSLPIYSSTVDNFEDPDFTAVYNIELLTSDVAYDMFLSGSTPVITIDSPESETEDRLIIFRDSFASSLAPLLLGHYRQITLVDVRYIMSNMLSDYVDFEGADVLFLYNVEVINRSIMLK